MTVREATGCWQADAMAGDRRMMLAALFIVSRRPNVPTFAYQLKSYDLAFPDVATAKQSLNKLSSIGVVDKRFAGSSVMRAVPAPFRGDSECYHITEEGLRILRVAYLSYRPYGD